MSERIWPDTIEVDANDLHDILRVLHNSSQQLDNEYQAALVYNAYLYLLKLFTEATGGEYQGQNPLPFGTPSWEIIEYLINTTPE